MSYLPAFDAYILKSQDFAKPILNHIREVVHKACPEVEEVIKWGMPFFLYEGSLLCSMAAFKQHCAFTFWRAAVLSDPDKILEVGERTAMGNLGKITSVEDLPADKIMVKYIKEAMQLNEENRRYNKKGVVTS